jgi:ABC-type antimicrobial peptide transport system permease subunit
MIRHYLKVAFRNLWKYKNQTLISVIGLATGFACFAMSALWIRYEMTYDGFHKNADRIYRIYGPDFFNPDRLINAVSYESIRTLKTVFPEITNAIAIQSPRYTFEYNGTDVQADVLMIDSSFFRMFDVKIVEGSMDFVIPENNKIAITREKSLQMFGNESPVGKTVKMDKDYTISAIVTGFPNHSNYRFDFITAIEYGKENNALMLVPALIELSSNIDVEAFKKKLYEYKTIGYKIIPLTEVHYKDPVMVRNVKFQHIIIFSIAGLLLILCSLFNYLTLFICRFRIRQRELALRVVCGASNRSLFALLSVEFVFSLVISLLVGLFFIQILISPFLRLSDIRLELSSIYLESLIYIAVIILVSLFTFLLTLAIFRYRTLNVTIRSGNRKMFRKISIAGQLIISIGFAFSTVIILKQMYHLHSSDLGFAAKDRGSIYAHGKIDIDMLDNKIRQIPEITETVKGFAPLLPLKSQSIIMANEWENKPESVEYINMRVFGISEQYMEYYELKLIEGEMVSAGDRLDRVLINESAVEFFGWDNPVGKSFGQRSTNKRTVKGVIKNIYSLSPTVPADPSFYYYSSGINAYSILFKYNAGTWKTCRTKIEKIFKEEYPNMFPAIESTEEAYDKYLQSENTLLQVLTLVSLVCIIVCVFGFVSMVSLTCEERRKEIAIRKINGATIKDILDIFFKEYVTLLVVCALIAFPAGYIIMKRWLEQYVIQTPIDAWIYLSILLALIMVIVICVGGRVYKTSRENPINAINR